MGILSPAAREAIRGTLDTKLGITDTATQDAFLDRIDQDGILSVMGIGSLVEYSHLEDAPGTWKQSLLEKFPEIDPERLVAIKSASLEGYERDFVCMDNFYRGTAADPGITLGLNKAEGGKTYGGVLETDLQAIGLAPERIPEFIQYYLEEFANREIPPNMPIYTFTVARPQIINGEPVSALLCVADTEGPMYAGGMSREDTARMIAVSRGPTANPATGAPKPRGSMTNLDYLAGVITSSERFDIPVEQHLLELYTLAVAFRQNLPAHERGRLEMFERPGRHANHVSLLTDFITAAVEGRQRVHARLGIDPAMPEVA